MSMLDTDLVSLSGMVEPPRLEGEGCSVFSEALRLALIGFMSN